MLKIVLLTRRVYLGTLELAIKANIRKERIAIKASTHAIDLIDSIQIQMDRLSMRIQKIEDSASSDLLNAQTRLNAEYNELTNLRDNV